MVEIHYLRGELKQSYSSRDWESLSRALQTLVRVSEVSGQSELSRHAKSIVELMGEKGAGRSHPGERVEELFERLMTQLSTVQWQNQTSSG